MNNSDKADFISPHEKDNSSHIKSILIVDDEELVRTQLQAAVVGIGRVHVAATGCEAIELCKNQSFDIMIIDNGLPDISGFKLASQLKSLSTNQRAKFIIISPKMTEAEHLKSLTAGVRVFLPKPVSSSALKNVVSLLLSEKSDFPSQGQTSQQRLTEILNQLSDVIVISDEQGTIREINQYGLDLFGYEKDELIGVNLKVLTPPQIRVNHDQYLADYKKTNQAKLIGNPREVNAVTKSGQSISIELNISEYWEHDEKHFAAVIRDITEKKELQEKLLKHTFYDNLTGLKTTSAMHYDFEDLDQPKYHNSWICAAMLDIDQLQEFNSVNGYGAGDKLIKALAVELTEIAQTPSMNAYRVSGDRFVIAIVDSNSEISLQRKEKLFLKLERITVKVKQKTGMQASFTSICTSRSVKEVIYLVGLLQLLEMTLLAARREGFRGKVTKGSAINVDYYIEKNILSQKLRSGKLDTFELGVAIQPKVNRHLLIVSAEALLRWSNPIFKNLYLSDFIEVAEATGAIIEIGYYVLRRVCRLLSELKPEHRIKIFINLSIRQLSDNKFIETVTTCCKDHDLPHSLLGFELTESMIAEDIDLVRRRLMDLSALGFDIAIDDFGTGQSNLKYIHKLPASSIKIDKSFVDEIDNAQQDCPIVDAVISLAHEMNKNTVAEGVETEAQAKYLWARGVDEIQGYFYYKPIPVNDFLILLNHTSGF